MLELMKTIPEKPGCYIYFDEASEVIYVGKAKNLKKRMSSYFNRANNTKTQHLVSKIKKFDYFITANEKEALILENNLIKKYTPFYNIVLKDDKKYPYIVITKNKYPQIIKSRTRKIQGTYFGPFPSGKFVTNIINYLNQKTLLHKCRKIPKEECIYYHLNQCYAPCIKKDKETETIIKEEVKKLKKLLQNNLKNLSQLIYDDMSKQAKRMNFEEAQNLKELYNQTLNLNESQFVQLNSREEVDLFTYYKDENFISLAILQIRDGKLINIHRSLVPYYQDEIEDLISYINEFYLLNPKPSSFATQEEALKEPLAILLSMEEAKLKKEEMKQLLILGEENTREYYRKNIERITKEFFVTKNKGFIELQRISNHRLNRIEMFDISHLGGDAQVGAMIVYMEGKKEPKEYRKYKIKEEANLQNDYGSITEVVTRRIVRGIKEGTLPDMIVIDGGKGQVSTVLKILEQYGLTEKILLIGLSKDNKHSTKGMVNKNLQEHIFNKQSQLYKFFYQMQEEVHRFAIDFHRNLKVKSLFQMKLDQIPGIGPKRKQQLLQKFEYLENIKKATKEDLKELKIPDKTIEEILSFFQKNK